MAESTQPFVRDSLEGQFGLAINGVAVQTTFAKVVRCGHVLAGFRLRDMPGLFKIRFRNGHPPPAAGPEEASPHRGHAESRYETGRPANVPMPRGPIYELNSDKNIPAVGLRFDASPAEDL